MKALTKAEKKFNSYRKWMSHENHYREYSRDDFDLYTYKIVSCVDSRGYFCHAQLRIPLPKAKEFFTYRKPRISFSFTREK